MNVANNYSKIKNRDKKIYSISGTKISSSGISYKFIRVASTLLFMFNILGAIICLIGGEFYYWPFSNLMEFQPAFLFIFIGGPLLLTMLLLYTKVQKYTLLEFIIAYAKPNKTRDQNGKVVKYTKYKQDTFVERIF